MTSPSVPVLTSLMAAATLASILASATTPSLSAGFDLGGEHLNQCLGPERVAKILKRNGYTDVQHYSQYSREYVYMYAAVKPKRDGNRVVWHLYYDACEQELVRKESQE